MLLYGRFALQAMRDFLVHTTQPPDGLHGVELVDFERRFGGLRPALQQTADRYEAKMAEVRERLDELRALRQRD